MFVRKKVYFIVEKRKFICKCREKLEEVKLFGLLSLVLANQFIKKISGLDFYSAEKKIKEKNLKRYKKYINNIETIEKEYKKHLELIG